MCRSQQFPTRSGLSAHHQESSTPKIVLRNQQQQLLQVHSRNDASFMKDGGLLVSDTVMQSSVSLLTECSHKSFFQHPDLHKPCGVFFSFLCSSVSLSPLPLEFLLQPTLSVGRRDRRCLANAPAGSVLLFVSVFTYNCEPTNKRPLLKI